MERKTCYTINFYLGDRRFDIEKYKTDKLCYLRAQLECLTKYKHSLSKIIFNFNVDPEHYPTLTDALSIIPSKVQDTDIEIIIRENYGMSYGAWSDVFSKYQDQYDYYIFNEDDYVIVQDNFDDYLVNKFNSLPNCGYLCGLVRETAYHKDIRHGGMSAGISSYEVLKKLHNKYGELPHSKNNEYLDNEHVGQTRQTNELIKLGYDIYDIREEYMLRFWARNDYKDTNHANYNNSNNNLVNRHFFWNDKDFFLPTKIYYNELYVWVDKINKEFLRMECDYKSKKYYEYDKKYVK